jgi:hypothetical protein
MGRERGKLLDSNGRERKSVLTPIPAIKIIDFDVNKFHLMIRVPLRYFFTFKLHKKTIFKLKKCFWLGLISSLCVVFCFLGHLWFCAGVWASFRMFWVK